MELDSAGMFLSKYAGMLICYVVKRTLGTKVTRRLLTFLAILDMK